MLAVQFSRFGDPSVLELVELPAPHPGDGEVRIHVAAAGVNASDWKKRQGFMDPELPQTAGYEASGIVDEVGDGVTGTAVGDRVFGASPYGAAQAGYAVLSDWAPLPAGLSDVDAAALPAAAETAARALDQVGVSQGDTLLINGASGSVGSAAVQLAVARGVTVIGTAGVASRPALTALGATAITYGDGMPDRARAAAPGGIDFALDVAEAHRAGESCTVKGKIVLLVDDSARDQPAVAPPGHARQSMLNQTNHLSAGSTRLPRGLKLTLGTGRVSDHLRSLKPIRANTFDVAARAQAQAARHMPVPQSV
ncbi:MAG: NADP-dependent oxidoreductase [Gordonia sp. (in: high G+C Gram-positive bacteria)]